MGEPVPFFLLVQAAVTQVVVARRILEKEHRAAAIRGQQFKCFILLRPFYAKLVELCVKRNVALFWFLWCTVRHAKPLTESTRHATRQFWCRSGCSSFIDRGEKADQPT